MESSLSRHVELQQWLANPSGRGGVARHGESHLTLHVLPCDARRENGLREARGAVAPAACQNANLPQALRPYGHGVDRYRMQRFL